LLHIHLMPLFGPHIASPFAPQQQRNQVNNSNKEEIQQASCTKPFGKKEMASCPK